MSRSAFVSYCHSDQESANLLVARLERAKWRVWVDDQSIREGEDLRRAIQEGVPQSTCLVVLYSEAAAGSRWVSYEMAVATEHRVPILVVRCDSVDTTALPPAATTHRWCEVDLPLAEESCDRVLNALVQRVAVARRRRWVGGGAAVVLVAAIGLGAWATQRSVQGWQDGVQREIRHRMVPEEPSPILDVSLHGDSPALSWSPDGRFVVATARFVGDDDAKTEAPTREGVFVVDVDRLGWTKVHSGPASNPVAMVGGGVGWYEDYQVFVLAPDGGEPRAVDEVERDLDGEVLWFPSTEGGVLVRTTTDADQEELQWSRLDPRSVDAPTSTGILADLETPYPPQGLYVPPCINHLHSPATVWYEEPYKSTLELGGRKLRLPAPYYYHAEWGAGAVSACISPTGRHVAMFVGDNDPQTCRLVVFQVRD